MEHDHPLLNWTRRDIFAYIQRHDLPSHPLLEKGYSTVGCAPCTRPIEWDEDERTGRWDGSDKIECGLHLNLNASSQEKKHK